MTPTMRKLKDHRGRITGYIASYAGVEGAVANSRVEAVLTLTEAVTAILANVQLGAAVVERYGVTITVAPARFGVVGWDYWLGARDGARDWPISTHPGCRRLALARAVAHAAQNAWTLDVADDAAFVAQAPELAGEVGRELLGWCSWQRSYAVLMAAGMTSDEARQHAR